MRTLKPLMLLAVCAAFLSAPALAAEKKRLINGIDANFPPFAFVDETGKPAGFDVEAMNWIAKDLGLEVSHMPMRSPSSFTPSSMTVKEARGSLRRASILCPSLPP